MPSNFTGNEGTFITLSAGGTMTAAFRSAFEDENKGYFFGKNKLNDILNQTDCMGIRIYFGVDKDDKINLVLVGTLANKCDMTTGYILDVGVSCPPDCGTANTLNS